MRQLTLGIDILHSIQIIDLGPQITLTLISSFVFLSPVIEFSSKDTNLSIYSFHCIYSSVQEHLLGIYCLHGTVVYVAVCLKMYQIVCKDHPV